MTAREQFSVAAIVTATGAALITAATGTAIAGENLPPLRVDPTLLGLPAPAAAKPPAAEPATAIEPPAPIPGPITPVVSDKPVAAPVVAAPAAPAAAVTQTAQPVTPSVSAPPPVKQTVRETPAVASQAAATPVAPKALPPAAAAQAAPTLPAAPVATSALAVAPPPTRPGSSQPQLTAQNMPLLRVDPALLGQAAPVSAAAMAVAPTPPMVGNERLPPLYSAHVDAGRLPAPPGYQKVPHDPNAKAPIYVTADRLNGTAEQTIVAEGNVELEQRDMLLTADKITYWQLDEEAEAEGNVVLTRPDARITGPKTRISLEDEQGYFEQPVYTIRREAVMRQRTTPDAVSSRPLHPGMLDVMLPQRVTTTGSGKADRVDFEGEGQYRFSNATYSTCPAGDNQDWYAQVSDLKLDYDREVGDGRNARVYFKGVPFLYTPVMSFSLNNQRKSGLLPATVGTNTKVGVQYYQPLYWNIAPNMDATLTSRVMSKRGVQLNGELRYLDYNYFGTSRFEYLPNDTTTGESRYAYSVLHNQNLGSGFNAYLNLNGVSDATYFTDLSTRIASIAQVNLLRQGVISYASSWWTSSLALEKYQTLQIPNQPRVAVPYASLPRINLNAARYDLPGSLAFNFQGEYVNFAHPTQVEGRRMTFYPQLSLPLQSTSFYITPKIGVHATTYQLQRQLPGQPDSINRTLPIFSVDSGVTFEREMQWKDSTYTQTLEPRLYYVNIPSRDQSQIPVFDTALSDFNFAQIFSENRYVGKDRIGDANQLTAAVTSRLIDRDTGVELIRGMIGQRYYFSDQRVTLNSPANPNAEVARTERDADLLAAITGLVAPKTYVDSGWQYNPRDSRTERFNLMARYQPEIGKVLNGGYRYTRNLLGQIDVSGQWPFGGGWTAIGRYNYSTRDKRAIEVVAGLEYNGGCWAIRGLLQRLSTTAQTETTSFFIQLELSGFSNIGSNPAEVLRRTVPGYSRNYGYNDPVTSGYPDYY
jgi:LPS-assembly protein